MVKRVARLLAFMGMWMGLMALLKGLDRVDAMCVFGGLMYLYGSIEDALWRVER